MPPPTHTDKSYEAELRALREKLLEMGGLVEQAIASSVRALTERDADLAEQVKLRDREINRMEVTVDGMCRRILALRQPAASDLRFITTALKIVTDLERMGDLAVNVAERALDLSQGAPLVPLHDFAKLADLSEAQARKALDAFVSADVAKAEEVIRGDEFYRESHRVIFHAIQELFERNEPIDLVSIALQLGGR